MKQIPINNVGGVFQEQYALITTKSDGVIF